MQLQIIPQFLAKLLPINTSIMACSPMGRSQPQILLTKLAFVCTGVVKNLARGTVEETIEVLTLFTVIWSSRQKGLGLACYKTDSRSEFK